MVTACPVAARRCLLLLMLALPALLASQIAWSQPLAWNLLSPPPPRTGHTAVYDPVRDRMVIYGGPLFAGGEVWALDLASPHWTRLNFSTSSPLSRWHHSAVYDPPRDRMVIYGGRDSDEGVLLNDCWGLSLTTNGWSGLAFGGSAPGPNAYHVAVVDAARQRMFEFGGEGFKPLSTIYRLDLVGNAWSSVATAGTPPSASSAMTGVADPLRDRMLVLVVGTGVYELTFSAPPTWTLLSPGGTAPPTLDGVPVYDSARDRVLLMLNGGTSVWSLSLAPLAWSPVTTSGTPPPAGGGASSIYDPVRDRLVVTAGAAGNDTYALDLATNTWSLLLSPGTVPPRWDHSAIVAPTLDAMLVYAGAGGPGNDVLVYPLDAQHTWTTMATSGPTPPGRSQHASCFDAAHNRMLVFGGTNSGGYLNDVQALTLSGTPTWSPIVAAGGPGARTYPTASYDRVRDQLLIFGGADAGGHYYTDVWALTLSGSPTWTQLIADAGIPQLEPGSSAFYDGRRDRLVVIGPPVSSPQVTAWALNLSGTPAWTQIAAPGAGPGDLRWWGAALDSLGDRVFLYGGLLNSALTSSATLYSLTLGSPTQWTAHNLSGQRPMPRLWCTMVHDKNRLRSVLFGGREDDLGNVFPSYPTADVWMLQQDASTPVLVSVASAEAVGGAVRVVWQVPDDPGIGWRVERAERPGAWLAAGLPQVMGADRLEYRDAAVQPGARYGYRLVASGPEGEQPFGEAWVSIPAVELALSRMILGADRWLRFDVRVPAAGAATVEAFDPAGRRLGRTRLDPASPGIVSGALQLNGGRAGLYLVRLTQGARSVTRRLTSMQ